MDITCDFQISSLTLEGLKYQPRYIIEISILINNVINPKKESKSYAKNEL